MKRAVSVLAAVCCLLSGCASHAAEPEGLALVRVLGVDGGEEITLTAVCPGQQGAEPVRGSAAAPEFEAARARLPGAGEREMALTNLSYLIINENADLASVLLEVLRDREMSPSATVWYAENAEELLAACKDPTGRLEVLSGQGVEAPTVVDALAALESSGVVRLPVLKEKDGMLTVTESVLWERKE